MNTHEFVFVRLTALADGLGLYVGFVLSFLSSLLPPIFVLELIRFGWFPLLVLSFLRVTPKASVDGGASPENPETSGDSTVPTENTNVTLLLIPRWCLRRQHHLIRIRQATSFSAVSNLKCATVQLTALLTALPPRTSFLPFFRDSDPRCISVLAEPESEARGLLPALRRWMTTAMLICLLGLVTCAYRMVLSYELVFPFTPSCSRNPHNIQKLVVLLVP